MKKIQLALCMALFSGLFSGNPVLADQAGRVSVGGVEKLRHKAEAIHADSIRPLAVDSDVFLRDLLKTALDSRLEVRFEDGSRVTLGENAELIVDEFVYVQKQERTMTLSAVKGALRFIGSKTRSFSRGEAKVITPLATLGVRGTDFWLGPIDGETGVLVLEGKVVVESRLGLVSLGPGEGTMIGDDGALSPAKTWGDAKRDRALGMVAF